MKRLVAAIGVGVLAACSGAPPSSGQASAGPTVSPALLSIAPSSPTAASSAIPWILIASGWPWASWSPDGSTLLAWRQQMNGTPSQSDMWLYRADGSIAQHWPGLLSGMWLDDTTFVASRSGQAVRGQTGSTDLEPTVAFGGSTAVSSGSDAVAYTTSTGSFTASTTFRVWTPNGTSAVHAGVPVTWSRDGSKLIVWHFVRQQLITEAGWIEVVAWPSLRSIAAFPRTELDVPSPGALQFDPTGRYVVAAGRIHDLVTGADHLVTGDPGDFGIAWTNRGQLVETSLDTDRATAFDLVGHVVSDLGTVGDAVTASADGSTLAFSAEDDRPVTIWTASGTHTISVPGPGPSTLWLSPNGSAMAVYSGDSLYLLPNP